MQSLQLRNVMFYDYLTLEIARHRPTALSDAQYLKLNTLCMSVNGTKSKSKQIGRHTLYYKS